jgi:O-methyltransferase
LSKIRRDCLEHKWNFMLTTPDQAAFLFTVARSLGARKILELGCYFGHSTLAMAAALPPDGKILSIEHNPKFARAAQEHLKKAGVDHMTEIMIGEAPELIKTIESSHALGSFDMVFVDADKRHFHEYWESSLRLVRSGGVIVFDNVLCRGEILNASVDAASHITAVREFNAMVNADERVFSFIATIADGMLVATKL